MDSSSSNKGVHLVVGGDSMIGAALAAALRAADEVVHASTRRPERVAPDRPFLDLGREAGPDHGDFRYGTAYLCAAVARLNDCFNDPRGSAAVNVVNAKALARRLAAAGTDLLFLSSNQVLGGDTPFPDERVPPAPANVYGQQKAEAERAILQVAEEFPAVAVSILRLSKVLPPDFPLFADWAGRLRRGMVVEAAADMTLAPVPVRLAVDTMRRLAAGRHRGLFQLSASAEIDYVAAARHLCRRLRVAEDLVRPVSAVGAGFLKEPPPRHTILDSGALTQATGIRPLDPFEALDEAFGGIVDGGVTA